jgi:hypothetical protein
MISGTAGGSCLDGRAFYGAITAKYTAISFLWFEYGLAIGACIKILAGVCGHCFFFLKTTGRTGNS